MVPPSLPLRVEGGASSGPDTGASAGAGGASSAHVDVSVLAGSLSRIHLHRGALVRSTFKPPPLQPQAPSSSPLRCAQHQWEGAYEVLSPRVSPPVMGPRLGIGASKKSSSEATPHRPVDPAAGAVLSCSRSGRFVSIVWPHLKCYVVYDVKGDDGSGPNHTPVASGGGVDVAWSWVPYPSPSDGKPRCIPEFCFVCSTVGGFSPASHTF